MKRTTKKTVAECGYYTTPTQFLMNLRMLRAAANHLSGDPGCTEAFWLGKVYDRVAEVEDLVLADVVPDETLRAYVHDAMIDEDPGVAFEELLELAKARKAEHES